jgi:hypothetical protein
MNEKKKQFSRILLFAENEVSMLISYSPPHTTTTTTTVIVFICEYDHPKRNLIFID